MNWLNANTQKWFSTHAQPGAAFIQSSWVGPVLKLFSCITHYILKDLLYININYPWFCNITVEELLTCMGLVVPSDVCPSMCHTCCWCTISCVPGCDGYTYWATTVPFVAVKTHCAVCQTHTTFAAMYFAICGIIQGSFLHNKSCANCAKLVHMVLCIVQHTWIWIRVCKPSCMYWIMWQFCPTWIQHQ